MSILDEIIKAEQKKSNISVVKQAQGIQEKCAQVGFDWRSIAPVFDKVLEEVEEVKEARNNVNKGKKELEEEMGDLLFACINLSRHLHLDAELCLQKANSKFVKRFMMIEDMLKEKGQDIIHTNDADFEVLWTQVKNMQNGI